ncbi:MAG: hypothetical protein IH987_04695 [Planctomycetes bacterium]|nr:hypothetical protein [Planctomycetota bacterium]
MGDVLAVAVGGRCICQTAGISIQVPHRSDAPSESAPPEPLCSRDGELPALESPDTMECGSERIRLFGYAERDRTARVRITGGFGHD